MVLLKYALDYNQIQPAIPYPTGDALALEDRTARITILVDPRKKAVFERVCAEDDTTPSQVIRRLIRQYIEERTGAPWSPAAAADKRTTRKRSGNL